MELIRRNFGLKALSVLIAIVLWFAFNHTGASAPISTKTLELELGVRGVQSGFVPSTPTKTVVVEFAGPRGQLDSLGPGQFTAFVDSAGKREGLYSLPVEVVGPGSDLVRTVTPAQAVVTLDKYAYRSVPVVAQTTPGKPAPQVVFTPKTVTVAGAQALVVQALAAAVLIPPVADWKSGAAMAKPVPVDAKLNPVNGVTIAPAFVRISGPTPRSKTR